MCYSVYQDDIRGFHQLFAKVSLLALWKVHLNVFWAADLWCHGKKNKKKKITWSSPNPKSFLLLSSCLSNAENKDPYEVL